MTQYCKQCYEDYKYFVRVKTLMFDIDGTNLEELPICPLHNEHNIQHDHFNNKEQQTFTHDYLDILDIIEIPSGNECHVYAESFIKDKKYLITDGHWEEVWRQVTQKYDPEYTSKQYLKDFIGHWFECTTLGKSNTISGERCDPLVYDEQFELVDSYVSDLNLESLTHMALFGLLITLSHDFIDYLRDYHEELYFNIILRDSHEDNL